MSEPTEMELLAALFHDLRDPLAAVQMQSRSLLKVQVEGPDAERVKRRSEAIARSSERALGLLGDVQDLFRLRRGALAPSPAPRPLSLLSEVVARSARHAAQARQIRLTVEVLPADAVASYDGALISRALHHLTLLAIAYAAQAGSVRMTLHRNPKGVVGHVGEEGVTPSQAAPSRSETLGLTLARTFLEAHPGGTLIREGAGHSSFNWTSA